ncbi:MAG: hypothetical protein ACM3IH_14085 [Sphingobacteriales bacterium]
MVATNIADLPKEQLQQFAQQNIPQDAAPPPPASTPDKKISLGILAHDGKIYARTMMCIIGAAMACARNNWGLNVILREGDSMVARGRSFIASQFLEAPGAKDCTDLVFIDTDLAWEGDEFERLCKHDADVVGGAYPYKDESGDFPLRWPPDGLKVTEDGLWEVDAVTPGFFRVTRRALEKIARLTPWIEFKDRGSAPGQRNWMFFDNVCRPSGVYDEGYIFCEHWRQIGGKVYLDPTLRFSHIGPKAFNHGTILDWLNRKAEKFDLLESEFPGVPALKLMDKVMGMDVDLTAEHQRLREQKDENELNELAKKTMEGMKALAANKDDAKPPSSDESFGPIVSGVAA